MKKLFSDKVLLTLVIFTVILKTVVWLQSGRFTTMFSDEERNYQIALNHHQGLGYTIDGNLTAFHSSTPVFLYEFLIENEIPKSAYVIFSHVFSIILFAISIYFFDKTQRHFGTNFWLRNFLNLVYVVYPSNLIYIGSKFNYERIALPIIIICFYYLLCQMKGDMRKRTTAVIALLTGGITLFRPQLIFILPFIMGVFAFISIITEKSWSVQIKTLLLALVAIIIFHLPTIRKNYEMFGAYILSTQAGFELMQGHSDIARGSWNGDWENPLSDYAEYSRKSIPGIDELNEYEQSIQRKSFAVNWIINNPKRELILIARKVAIFFIPRNFLGGFNLMNALTHSLYLLSFIGFTFVFTKEKSAFHNALLINSPIIAVLILSVVFFVGYRWRYYAEPFMLLWISHVAVKLKKLYFRRNQELL